MRSLHCKSIDRSGNNHAQLAYNRLFPLVSSVMPYEEMLYETLDDLWTRLPNQATRCEFDDGTDWAAYIARWRGADFDSMRDFVHFCVAYSSVMQFVIPNQRRLAAGLQMYRDEATDWFVPNEAPELLAISLLEKYGTEQRDATQWLRGNLDFVHVPWLNDGDHDTCLLVPGDEFSELYSFGKEGYLTIFAINN